MVNTEVRKIVLAVFSIFGAVIFLLAMSCNAFADDIAPVTASSKFSVDVNNAVLELTIPSTPAVIDLNPTMTGASFGSTSIDIKVATNNITGYTLTMTPTNNTEATSLIRTELVGDEQNYREIETLELTDPISTGYTEQTFTANKWGYKITGDNYYGIDPENTTVSHPAWTTDASTNGTNHNLTLAAKVDADTVSGAYETTLNFHAITNAVPLVTLEMSYGFHGKQKVTVGNEEYYKMQDMSTEICSYTNEIPSELQVVDIRDDKIYWIAKLADGHCWMTQNLDLDLETTPDHVLALTSENTDLNTYGSNGYDSSNGYSKDANGTITFIPERATIPASSIYSDGTIPGWVTSSTDPYSADTGDWYWIGNWKKNGIDTWYSSMDSYIYLNIDSSGAGDKFSTDPYEGNGTHGHVGNYYNWPAAIASNRASYYNTDTKSNIINNPQNSICPAGWRLPTISDDVDESGSTNEFKRLTILYGNTTSYDKAFTASPLWFVRGGSVSNGSLGVSGRDGAYWSSTVNLSYAAYGLSFYAHGVNPIGRGNSQTGRSVRCIAR